MVANACDGFVEFTDNDQINRLLNEIVAQVRGFTQGQMERIRTLTEIGRALSAEKNMDLLLEMIVDEARRLPNADGGTLYIMNDDKSALKFAIVQNESLGVRMGGTGGDITWEPIPLVDSEGRPNHSNVSAYAALSGEVVNIPDVYHAEGFNFEGTRRFDASTGYRSMSMLVVPMRNHGNDIIGVLQLLNAKDAFSGKAISFSPESREMTESLASQAAVALTNNQLINDLKNLLQAFIAAIATAIDEKSPYTGGHVKRVAELTMELAEKINEATEGPFALVNFDRDALEELKLSAWLHDVGKITTPEHVVDKSTKLEGIYDRIEVARVRVEVIKRDLEIRLLKDLAGAAEETARRELMDKFRGELGSLDQDMDFLASVNIGGEFMADEMIDRVKSIASRSWTLNGLERSLLEPEEVENLCIRRGTLNETERAIINNHVEVTYRMLSQLPFPNKIRNVPAYASAHHEKLDGTGYPLGLADGQLPLQARMMALADVFEALTARDRPYKKGKSLSEALKILASMVKDRHLDGDLFRLLVDSGICDSYTAQGSGPEPADQRGKRATGGILDGKTDHAG